MITEKNNGVQACDRKIITDRNKNMMMYLNANKQGNERKKPLHVETIYEVINILLLV